MWGRVGVLSTNWIVLYWRTSNWLHVTLQILWFSENNGCLRFETLIYIVHIYFWKSLVRFFILLIENEWRFFLFLIQISLADLVLLKPKLLHATFFLTWKEIRLGSKKYQDQIIRSGHDQEKKLKTPMEIIAPCSSFFLPLDTYVPMDWGLNFFFLLTRIDVKPAVVVQKLQTLNKGIDRCRG